MARFGPQAAPPGRWHALLPIPSIRDQLRTACGLARDADIGNERLLTDPPDVARCGLCSRLEQMRLGYRAGVGVG